MRHRANLIERDGASSSIHAYREDQLVAGRCAAFDYAAGHRQHHCLTCGRVYQSSGPRIDAHRVGNRARTVSAKRGGEVVCKVGCGVGRQDRFVHHQSVGHSRRADARRVVRNLSGDRGWQRICRAIRSGQRKGVFFCCARYIRCGVCQRVGVAGHAGCSVISSDRQRAAGANDDSANQATDDDCGAVYGDALDVVQPVRIGNLKCAKRKFAIGRCIGTSCKTRLVHHIVGA